MSVSRTPDDVLPPADQVLAYVLSALPLITSTGTTFAPQLAHAWGHCRLSNAGGIAVALPAYSVVPFPVKTELNFEQVGAGILTFSAPGGTINSRGGIMTSAGQWAVITAKLVDFNTWLLMGDLA